jgi:hypothetical protein
MFDDTEEEKQDPCVEINWEFYQKMADPDRANKVIC